LCRGSSPGCSHGRSPAGRHGRPHRRCRSPGWCSSSLAGVLLHAFARFVIEGLGTPAPVAPTERLVVGGLYRHVRNPMYLAVGATIVGQALVLGRPGLLVYTAVFGVVVGAFVHGYEQPTLAKRYGEQYEAYRRAVPAWWPRRRPWDGS